MVPGACEGSQDAAVGTGSFHFHYPACWEQDLNVHLQVLCLAPGTLEPPPLSSQHPPSPFRPELCSLAPLPAIASWWGLC